MDDDLPLDIAEEDLEAAQIRAYYKKGRVFPLIRSFRALRQRAPGALAKTIFSVILSTAACYVLLRNYDATGPRAVLAMIYLVIIIGVCFWATGRLWRVIGLRARNAMRYLIGNMWSLYFGAIAIVGTIMTLFFPQLLPEEENARPAAFNEEPAVALTKENVAPEVPDEASDTVSRVYAGDGWEVLADERGGYAPETIVEAHAKCRALGANWFLADEKDLETAGEELIAGGHSGSFWTADRRDNSYLHYEIVDGEGKLFWGLAARDRTRNVLCVDRDSLGGGVAIMEY